MRNVNDIRASGFAAAAIGALLAGASQPASLATAQAGLWEVARPGAPPQRLCVADPAALAQLEHRAGKCTRSLLRQAGSAATVHYTCTGGDFGHSSLTVLTPRSMRIETQGIAGNAPFKYVAQARRVGNCPAH